MVKKCISLSILIILLNLSWFKIFAQEIRKTTFNSDATISQGSNNYNLKAVSFIIPGTLIAYGSLKPVFSGIQQLDNNIMSQVKKNHPDFHTHADDYIIWIPSASIYIADAFKIKTRHTFGEHLLLDAGSIIVTGSIGYAMKKIVENSKTYNSQHTKYPSGHTANAFRGAEIIHQEFKDGHNLLSYSGYLVATTVGVLRIYNKNHLLTEVLAGAGVGILSTKLTYWVFNKWKDKNYHRIN